MSRNKRNLPADYYDLVDITTIHIDKNLPKEERIMKFVKEIKNPYRFRCGEFVVNTVFSKDGPTIEECIEGIIK